MASPYQHHRSLHSSSGVSQSGCSGTCCGAKLHRMRARQLQHPSPQQGRMDPTPNQENYHSKTGKTQQSGKIYRHYRRRTMDAILAFRQRKSLTFLSGEFALILQFCNINCPHLFPPFLPQQTTGDLNNTNWYHFISDAES